MQGGAENGGARNEETGVRGTGKLDLISPPRSEAVEDREVSARLIEVAAELVASANESGGEDPESVGERRAGVETPSLSLCVPTASSQVPLVESPCAASLSERTSTTARSRDIS